ncbi:dephospho-CoA kinase [Lacicoccus qingdaonensis]|uniref:Dephospho-CoA kinase n=1 Tax=Lacicoccus qingdaonensis TaxID=576118 RepID=A0A1G9E3D3_9BACL|nr:dephospho-CoA kinase [Salinicoccus qingdaonensis]SDK70577.1 dephospho-CoA kinase [Salinicoccus qingdaonensis]
MYKVIGLTGGIASGKSTASDYIRSLGFEVLDADVYARKVTEKDSAGYHKIIEAFGTDILDENKEIDRRKLGEIIFNDPEERKKLNGISHPEIRRMMNADQEAFLKHNHVFLDIPLLFENGLDKNCDITITVYVTKENQMERLMERNNLTEKEAASRVNSQMSLDEKKNLSDYVFDNNNDKKELFDQIDEFVEMLKKQQL